MFNVFGMKLKTIGRICLFIISYKILSGIFQVIALLSIEIIERTLEFNLNPTEELIVLAFDLLSTFLVCWLFMRFVNKEQFIELGFQIKNRLKDFLAGFFIGLTIMFLGYSLLIYFEEITFISVNFDSKELIKSILLFTIVAIGEEILFRGYILKNLMSSFNNFLALISSSILFSLIHAFNPNIDLLSLFTIFLAGITLGLSYIYTKNLWFPIALHLSWNLFQALLGFNVSGQESYSIIEFNINEANVLNGGAFGFEGSYLSIIAELLTIIGIWLYYNKSKLNKLSFPIKQVEY